MSTKSPMVRRYRRHEQGQSLFEYALIMVLVAIATIVSLLTFGDALTSLYRCAHYGIAGTTSAPVRMIHDNEVMNIACGGTVEAGDITMYAETFPGNPDTVRMTVNGPNLTHSQDEGVEPYALFGNSGSNPSDFGTRNLGPGNYQVEMVGIDGDEDITLWFIFNVR